MSVAKPPIGIEETVRITTVNRVSFKILIIR